MANLLVYFWYKYETTSSNKNYSWNTSFISCLHFSKQMNCVCIDSERVMTGHPSGVVARVCGRGCTMDSVHPPRGTCNEEHAHRTVGCSGHSCEKIKARPMLSCSLWWDGQRACPAAFAYWRWFSRGFSNWRDWSKFSHRTKAFPHQTFLKTQCGSVNWPKLAQFGATGNLHQCFCVTRLMQWWKDWSYSKSWPGRAMFQHSPIWRVFFFFLTMISADLD